jgi:hypothetical protein
MVLDSLGHRGPQFAQQRTIDGQRLIDAFEHHHGPLADQHPGEQVGGEWTEHRQVEDTDLEAA